MTPLALHIVYCTYGFWLPNDPRGSWSTFVGNRRLYDLFGPATKVATRESLAHRPHDQSQRLAAKRALRCPPAVLNERQGQEVGQAIGEVAAARGLVVLACAIMPDHVHLVTRFCAWTAGQIVASCRSRASRRLHESNLWPEQRPIWARGHWTVFLDSEDDVLACVSYVDENPPHAGLPPQSWQFVTKC